MLEGTCQQQGQIAEAADAGRLIEAFLARFPAFGVYRFEFSAQEPISLPAYTGSAWRGLFGHGLRRTLCVTRQPTCEGCLLVGSCVYSTLFESPPRDPADQARYNAVPHPYLLRIDPQQPGEIAPGAPLEVGVHLFGPAVTALPYLVHALGGVGERGIGRGHGRFRLERVWQLAAPTGGWTCIHHTGGPLTASTTAPARAWAAGAAPERIRLQFQSPLRMKRQGSLVGPKEFGFGELFRQLLWRLNDLARHHGGSDARLEWANLAPAVDRVRVARSELRWRDWTRYSSRQDALMQLGGLIGEIALEGEGLATLWPLLRLGQWTHLGKATTMGLGWYLTLDAASLRDAPPLGEAPTLAGVGADH